MIAAGIGDDAAFLLLGTEGRDLVVSPPQLERADGWLVFWLQVKLAALPSGVRPSDQFGADSNALDTGPSFADVVQSDDGISPR
jgi:hypothetical protein